MKKIFLFFGIDKSISYVLLGRGCTVLSGVATLFFIAKYLSPELQGYYFSFLSIIAFQVVFELGLGAVLTQFVSHEMSQVKIKDGELVGNVKSLNRVYSVIRLAIVWYSVVGIVILSVLIPGGLYFFLSSHNHVNINQVAIPWVLLVFTSACSLIINALLSIADGLGYIENVARMRFHQALFSGFFASLLLISYCGLYTVLATSVSTIIIGGVWIGKNLLPLVSKSLHHKNRQFSISWQHEILPMQWRIALSWFCGYFIFQVINPLSFKYYGASFTGRLGMAMTVLNMMVSLALAWITTKVPKFGRKISIDDKSVYQDYVKTFNQSVFFFLFMVLSTTLIIWGFNFFKIDLSQRIISTKLYFVLCLSMLANHIVACQASFIRSHKIELYTPLSVVTAIILTLSIFVVCNNFASDYLIYIYALVSWAVYVPGSYYLFNGFIRKMQYV